MICHSCNQPFPDYGSLAKHISSSKKGHRKGKKWAATYLLVHNLSANKKRDKPNRTPLTEQEKMNKAEIVRDISGIEETVTTVCPKCKKSGQQSLPVEYVESRDAWRTKSGCLIVMCYTCYQNRTDKPWGYT